MNQAPFLVPPGKRIRLKDYDPGFTAGFAQKSDAAAKSEKDLQRLAQYQSLLYAQSTHGMLIILQGMDTSGKDGLIRHLAGGINLQSTHAYSFKAPSAEELGHDFLWRSMKSLPERGGIAIFNRSYYEEVLVVRVHPELLDRQRLPASTRGTDIWTHRFKDINRVEEYLVRNGIVVLKFFLHLSKEEQKRRFLARIETPEKNWKFSLADVKERAHWSEYMSAYEAALNHTSTTQAPWHIVPADYKWVTRLVVTNIVVEKLNSLRLRYPVPSAEHRRELLKARKALVNEPERPRAILEA